SAPLDGEVEKMMATNNARVAEGDPLVKMNDELQQNQVAAVKLQVELAKAEQADALNEWERAQDLKKRNGIGAREHRQAELAYKVAQIQVRRAEQSVAQEEARLKRYTVKAPFAGRVIGVESDTGASLRIAEPILMLVQLDVLEAKLSAPFELYGKLKEGQTYTFEAGHPVNRRIKGTLKTSEPIVDSASKSFRTTFTIANADESLPSGFAVRLIWPQPADNE
nr:efflux RND transporter periplasmic adaptor subunit [Pseudomonadota bacterium]